MKKIFFILFIIFVLTGCSYFNQPEVLIETNTNQAVEEELTDLSPKIIPTEARVPILIYHHIRPITDNDSAASRDFIVNPTQFKLQMDYLKDNGFNTISFKNLVDYFQGDFELPEKPVIISFDDGNINQYSNAFPILKAHDFKATFFIFTNPIGKSENYLNWEQLNEMVEAGMEIGSHGWYHQYLTKISNEELIREVVSSKEKIEENLGQKVVVISYPFGLYNQAVTELIQEAGYLAARDIVNGVDHKPEDLYNLKAYFITSDFLRFTKIVEP